MARLPLLTDDEIVAAGFEFIILKGPNLKDLQDGMFVFPEGKRMAVTFKIGANKSFECTLRSFEWSYIPNLLCMIEADARVWNDRAGNAVSVLVKISYCAQSRQGSCQFGTVGIVKKNGFLETDGGTVESDESLTARGLTSSAS